MVTACTAPSLPIIDRASSKPASASAVYHEGVARVTTADSPETARQRDDLERSIFSGKTSGHDQAAMLERVGDIGSVPALLEVLRKNPPPDCTHGHALSAHRTITGQDAGKDYASWKAWWDEYQKTHPGT
jgi:hypothetical protein